MSRRRAKNAESSGGAAEERVDVLCGCGWGRLQCPLSEAPAACPLCGMAFDREIVVENPQEVETSGRCGHCGSDPCRDLENCDLWWGTNIGPKTLAAARARAELAPRKRSGIESPGPDYEAMILDEQDERYEMNRRNPRAVRLSDSGAPLDRESFKTRGRGTFQVEPLDGYRALKVTPWERGLPQGEIRAARIDVTDERELSNNPRRIAHPRGKTPRRDWWKRRNSGHECPADGTDQRGRCVGLCGQCGEHGLTTGRYTSYCPSCQTCEACGCPQADGFSHYEGCRYAVGDVAHLAGEERNVHLDMPLPPPPTAMVPNGGARHRADGPLKVRPIDGTSRPYGMTLTARRDAGSTAGRVRPSRRYAWHGSRLAAIEDTHQCPPDGKTQRGDCVGFCDECGEHGLTTGRYTSYCPSCHVCEECGCPDADGFSHYEGCRYASGDVAHLAGEKRGVHLDMPLPRAPHTRIAPNPRHDKLCPCVKCEVKKRHKAGCSCGKGKCEKNKHWSAQSGHYPGQSRCPKCEGPCGVKTRRNHKSSGRKAVIVEVDIGLDDSIDDVLADPNVTDGQIDAALSGFDPSRTFTVRSDVEEILRRAGIKAAAHSSQVDGTVVLAYAIPMTHNPVVVAAALKKFFKGQKDVRVSLSK